MKDMMKSVSSWTVKLLAAAGVCLGLGLQTAEANWGDTCYWKDNASSTNWNSDSWYNSTQGWDNHNPNYEGGRELHFDNNNRAGGMGNNFTGVGQKQYRLIFDSSATSQRIIRGSTWNTNWDNGGQMPKVENYATVEHKVLYPIAIGNANGMEMNPINGDLTMTNVAAMGHALNVYGSNGKTLKIANFYAGTNTAASAPSTVYVDSTSTVMIKSWRGASSKVQTANVNAAGGLLVVSNLDGKAVWIKSGAGTMRVETSSGASNLNLTVSAGRLELAPTTSTTSLTNLWVTNSATVVLHKPVSLRRVTLNPNCVVEMDVLGNQSVASLGVLPESVDSSHQFVCASGNKHTLKLKYTSGFDPTQDAEWVVYVGRKKSASGGSMTSAETSQMTLDTSDLAAHGATGTFSDPTLCANSSGAPNTAIKVTYTAPSAPQAAVGLATTTFTYAGSGITLTPTGGSGTGAYSVALVSGGTGAGSLSGTTLTVTKAGTFLVDVTRAAGGGYAARTDRVTVTVNKGTQTISGLGNVTKTYGDAAFALSGTAAGAVTYSSGNTSVATVSGSTVTIAGAGSATITSTAAAMNAIAAKARAAKLEKDRTAKLVKTGAVPEQTADDAEATYLFYTSFHDALKSFHDRLTAGERTEDKEAARAKVQVAEQEVARAKAQLTVAERALKDAKLVAPTDGIVRDRLLEPGELAAPSRPVLSLAATNPKWIRCYVSETNLAKHKLNDKAKIKADGCEKPFDGWIGYISPTAEFTPKTIETDELRPTLVYETRVYVNDPDGVLKLGAPVVVELE